MKAEDKTSLPAPDLVKTDAEMSGLEGVPEPEPETKPTEKAAKGKRAKLLPEPLEAAKPVENGASAEPVTAAATSDVPNDAAPVALSSQLARSRPTRRCSSAAPSKSSRITPTRGAS